MRIVITPRPGRVGTPTSRLAEIVYLLDVFAVGLMALGLLVGLNPLTALVPSLVLVASVPILLWHHLWFERNRSSILAEPGRHAARERRGF